MSLRIPGVFSSRSSSFHLQCSHDFQQVLLGPKTFQVEFLQTAYFHILHSFSRTFLQIGSVLPYSLISFLAIPLVGASFLTIGAWFQCFPVSLEKCISARFVFPAYVIIRRRRKGVNVNNKEEEKTSEEEKENFVKFFHFQLYFLNI